jgi:SecD/SecF fusion protein
MIYVTFATALAFLFFLVWYLAASDESIRRWVGLGSIVSLLACSLLSLHPLKEKVRLGLDLKGGTAFTIELQGTPTESALEQAVEVIRKRVDKFGLSEPIIQPAGANRINVQIPGLSEADKNSARTQLSKVAKLDFRLVHPDNAGELGKLQSGGQPPLGYDLLIEKERAKNGQIFERRWLVERRVTMSGKYVSRAFRNVDELSRPTVVLQFNDAGRKMFGEVTGANVGRQLAIVLDDEVKSAPVINQAIYGDSAVISGGNMTPAEAEELSSVLENPLETPVKILEERGVDPSLGQDSIQSGSQAGLIAFLGVVIFVVIYYRISGIIAVVSMVVNLVVMLGLLAQFNFTLTLPGIAGIILTIGMAVDANVLIYERIRDELALGKSLRAAVAAGFDRAFSAIVDSNITTLIPATVLIFLGSGPLQGFAVTLTLGIIANLFAALVVSRNAFEWLLHTHWVSTLHMLRFLEKPNFDFLWARWIGLILSAAVLVAGGMTFSQKGDKLIGVDFTGGDALTLSYHKDVPVAEIRRALDENKISDSQIQYFQQTGTEKSKLLVQVKVGEGSRVRDILQSTFPDAGFTQAGLDSVGPQVGGELKQRAIFALALGLLGILVYAAIRFEWSFAVASALGQLHDVLIALGIMALLGRELTLPLVGAFLTIAGYSINDKIVVFDRIREGMRLNEKGTFYEIINRALNLTLARTLLTGGTTIIATLALIFFGGSVIHDFSVAMLIGILSGIYSSHFISPPLAWWIDRHELLGRRKKTVAAGAATTAA